MSKKDETDLIGTPEPSLTPEQISAFQALGHGARVGVYEDDLLRIAEGARLGIPVDLIAAKVGFEPGHVSTLLKALGLTPV
jgi:hypothetical protein